MTRDGASRGGKSTVRKHGKSHMAEIGKRGFETTVNRHWQGDKQSYLQHLRERANQSVMESFVDMEMNRRLSQGEQTVCIELPCITDPDEPW